MNKKGFTLLEALFVVAILGVLMLMLIPSVMTLINKNKEKSCLSTKESIIKAARMYANENKYDLGIACDGNDEPIEKYADNLINLGYLDDKELEKKFREEPVIIYYDCNSREFTYEYNVDCES